MMYNLINLANDAVTAVVTVAALMGANKAGWIQWIKKEEPVIAAGLQEGAHIISEIAQLPGAKLVEAELHHKVNDLTKQFRDSEIGRLAAVALNYTEKDWGQLSQVQKDALCLHLATSLPAEWNVSKADIETAFEAVQKAADAIAGLPVIQSADKFTEEAKAIESKPAHPAAAPEQTQTPA